MRIKAFTLIELLVVIFISVIVLSISIPLISHSREIALQSTCAMNMRAIGIGDNIYQTNNNSWMITMGNWYAPIPTGSNYTLVRDSEPVEYRDIWPDNIRWCPSLKKSTGYVKYNGTIDPNPPPPSGGGGPSTPTVPSNFIWLPLDYNKYATFGYSRPMLDSAVAPYVENRYKVKEKNFITQSTWYQYMKFENNYYTLSGKKYQIQNYRPYASDMILTYSTYKNVTSHNRGIGKVNGEWNASPDGSNSLWNDGSVTWLKFTTRENCLQDFKSILNSNSKSFVRESSSSTYYFVARDN